MAEESHDCSEIARVPGSSAWTSLSSDPNHTMAEESQDWIGKILGSTSEGRTVIVNLGKQGDIVTGVGGDFIKDVHGNIIKMPRCHFACFIQILTATMFITPTLRSAPTSTELYGGLTSGRPWDDGINDGVREITLVYGKCIDSICVAYDQDGQLVKTGKHGGLGGSHLHKPYPIRTVKIKLEYPDEFLIGVSGCSCSVPRMAPEVLRLLKFESNKRSFGPFGVEEGMPFNFRVKDGEQIVGFKGRNGWYLDGIGFHISRAPRRKLSRNVQESLVTTSELYGGVRGRDPWDDGIYDGVREITLVYGQCIDSICFAYDPDGKLVKTGKHGGFGGNHLHNNLSTVEIKLEYPNEFIVTVSGYSSSVPGMAPEVLRSLKFETNKRSFGPFGVQVGRPFIFSVKDGEKIVGLRGINGWSVEFTLINL
ncbi:hypothetical protein M0R45_031518 [Rubus argutus]|uniref:Jacalin-type lectin domain-containing protein n=1 Tax=Rubus argutus TaxID=59490 RepID=A0AAW1WHV1_RUBAR